MLGFKFSTGCKIGSVVVSCLNSCQILEPQFGWTELMLLICDCAPVCVAFLTSQPVPWSKIEKVLFGKLCVIMIEW